MWLSEIEHARAELDRLAGRSSDPAALDEIEGEIEWRTKDLHDWASFVESRARSTILLEAARMSVKRGSAHRDAIETAQRKRALGPIEDPKLRRITEFAFDPKHSFFLLEFQKQLSEKGLSLSRAATKICKRHLRRILQRQAARTLAEHLFFVLGMFFLGSFLIGELLGAIHLFADPLLDRLFAVSLAFGFYLVDRHFLAPVLERRLTGLRQTHAQKNVEDLKEAEFQFRLSRVYITFNLEHSVARLIGDLGRPTDPAARAAPTSSPVAVASEA
jgi:hypothetical protein